MAFHSALAIVSSVLIFPTSVAAQYTTRLRAVIGPLNAGFRQHLSLLEIPTTSQDFSPKIVRALASKAESALAPLAASARVLGRDVSWGRFSGKDLDGMQEKVQRLVMRAHGMNVYFSLTDPTRERFPVTPVPSHHGSPAMGTPNVLPLCLVLLLAVPKLRLSNVEDGPHRNDTPVLISIIPLTLSKLIYMVHCSVSTTGTHIYLCSRGSITTIIPMNTSLVCSSPSGI